MILPKYDPQYDPLEHLDQMGVRLVKRTLFHANAIWLPSQKAVAISSSIRSDLVHPTLSHECSHAENDDCGGHHPRNEARADLHAALRNVNPTEWDRLMGVHHDYDAICLELGITRRQFRAYFHHREVEKNSAVRVEKLGSATYVDPKMGAGQWRARVEVA